jgi:hypothetical protein
MRLPNWIIVLSFAGLVPFVAGPLCILAGFDPPWVNVDELWHSYVTLLAVFLAGSFWGFAIIAVNGAAGATGILIASALLLITWGATLLPFRESLFAFALIFLLLLLADYWRERALGSMPGYFALRATLTAGAIISIGLRIALP